MIRHIAYAHHHHGTIAPFGCYMELVDGKCALGAAVPCPMTHGPCRLADFARLFARCPCCEEMKQCREDCTYATDALSSDYEQMVMAREALKEAENV